MARYTAICNGGQWVVIDKTTIKGNTCSAFYPMDNSKDSAEEMARCLNMAGVVIV